MKKLKLNIQHLSNAEILSRQELKMILGGDGSGTTGSDECQEKGETCYNVLNCCNGLRCNHEEHECVTN